MIFKRAAQYPPFEKENAVGFHYQRIISTTIDDYHEDSVRLTLMSNAQRASVQTDAFEFKYLLKGKVGYTIGEEIFIMEAGDSIYFDATSPHIPKTSMIWKYNLLYYTYLICLNSLGIVIFYVFSLVKVNLLTIWY